MPFNFHLVFPHKCLRIKISVYLGSTFFVVSIQVNITHMWSFLKISLSVLHTWSLQNDFPHSNSLHAHFPICHLCFFLQRFTHMHTQVHVQGRLRKFLENKIKTNLLKSILKSMPTWGLPTFPWECVIYKKNTVCGVQKYFGTKIYLTLISLCPQTSKRTLAYTICNMHFTEINISTNRNKYTHCMQISKHIVFPWFFFLLMYNFPLVT